MQQQITRLLAAVLIGLLAAVPAPAEDSSEAGTVRIPWQEFRRLLELDKDEFVLEWEEFQIILRQTGFRDIPPFEIKDGRVVLGRAQFKNLLDRMRPPEDPLPRPPADYLMTSAVYTGRITPDSVRFHGDFELDIFPRSNPSYLKIPLFPLPVALDEARFDGEPALIFQEGNRHAVTSMSTGRHRITVDFSLKIEARPGPREVLIPIPRTSLTRLDVEIPETGILVEVADAQRLDTGEHGGRTRVKALLSPCEAIRIRWREKPPQTVKGPPRVYAETSSLISIQEDAVRISAAVSLSILQNTLSSVSLTVPDGYGILEVRGEAVGDWRESAAQGRSRLDITFSYPRQGGVDFTLVAEKTLSGNGSTIGFPGFEVLGAVRDKSFLGVSLENPAEVTPMETEGLDRLDVSELPPALIGRSAKPLLMGFRSLRPPFSLVLEIEKHRELPVIATVADSASGVTLFTEDGKLVHRIVYQIRNTSKPFLELRLPGDAQIWSVFVAGGPVRPRLKEDRILIPLNRSKHGAAGLAAFEVELIYFQKSAGFGRLGRGGALFPDPDLLVSEMLWSVYLPEGYRFLSFGGTVEKERSSRGVGRFFGETGAAVRPISPAPEEDKETRDEILREAGRVKSRFNANLALSEEQLVRQIENEARFGGRMRELAGGSAPAGGGVLPIHIRIPATGRLFRFAKTIVNREPLTMRFAYLSESLLHAAGAGLAALFLAAGFLLRRRIRMVWRRLSRKNVS